jgi:hypothetical protein
MICTHCGALLVEDRFMDWTARWRCLKCGHVQDSLSVENLQPRPEESRAMATAEPDYRDEEVHLGSESFVGNVTYGYHRAAVQNNRHSQKLQPPRSKNTRRLGQQRNPISS